MPSSSVEDYLRELFVQGQGKPESFVHMGSLAAALELSAGSATAMVQSLARDGYVDYRKGVGARLTDSGLAEALKVLRRHRLVEAFLVEVLSLDWSEVHAEAHRLEHAVSERVLERMDALLGHPGVDPHGDPIPGADGGLDRSAYPSLADAAPGAKLRVVRILDQDPAFLRLLESLGLQPGCIVAVEQGGALAGAFAIRVAGAKKAVLGEKAARSILVEAVDAEPRGERS